MSVISDTSAITNLAAIDLLNLFHLLYGQVIIPEAVYRELVDIDPLLQEVLKFKQQLG